MKNYRNQIQNGRELASHYVIRSENYLGWLFAFFGICSTYRSTFGCVRKYHFGDITKGVYKKSGAFRVYIEEKRIFTFDDNMDNSLFIEQMNRLHIPVWSYSFSLKMKKLNRLKRFLKSMRFDF